MCDHRRHRRNKMGNLIIFSLCQLLHLLSHSKLQNRLWCKYWRCHNSHSLLSLLVLCYCEPNKVHLFSIDSNGL